MCAFASSVQRARSVTSFWHSSSSDLWNSGGGVADAASALLHRSSCFQKWVTSRSAPSSNSMAVRNGPSCAGTRAPRPVAAAADAAEEDADKDDDEEEAEEEEEDDDDDDNDDDDNDDEGVAALGAADLPPLVRFRASASSASASACTSAASSAWWCWNTGRRASGHTLARTRVTVARHQPMTFARRHLPFLFRLSTSSTRSAWFVFVLFVFLFLFLFLFLFFVFLFLVLVPL